MLKSLKPIHVKYFPKKLEDGNLYVSLKFELTAHLCPCGCKREVICPIDKDGWDYKENDNGVTLTPSIGNWTCKGKRFHTHYFIRNNQIVET